MSIYIVGKIVFENRLEQKCKTYNSTVLLPTLSS